MAMAEFPGFFQSLWRGRGEIGWMPIMAIGLAGVLALLFIHIFMVILLATTALVLGKSLAERVLGPGTRIRFSVPWKRIIPIEWLTKMQKGIWRK